MSICAVIHLTNTDQRSLERLLATAHIPNRVHQIVISDSKLTTIVACSLVDLFPVEATHRTTFDKNIFTNSLDLGATLKIALAQITGGFLSIQLSMSLTKWCSGSPNRIGDGWDRIYFSNWHSLGIRSSLRLMIALAIGSELVAEATTEHDQDVKGHLIVDVTCCRCSAMALVNR